MTSPLGGGDYCSLNTRLVYNSFLFLSFTRNNLCERGFFKNITKSDVIFEIWIKTETILFWSRAVLCHVNCISWSWVFQGWRCCIGKRIKSSHSFSLAGKNGDYIQEWIEICFLFWDSYVVALCNLVYYEINWKAVLLFKETEFKF